MINSHALPDWRNLALPKSLDAKGSLLTAEDQQLVYGLSKQHFGNWGDIVLSSCFPVACTAALTQGLLENYRTFQNPRLKFIHAFDLDKAPAWLENPTDAKRYCKEIGKSSALIDADGGDTRVREWDSTRPIELLIYDISKDRILDEEKVMGLFSTLVPGHSIIVQQDCVYRDFTHWLPLMMEVYKDYFEIVDHTSANSVAYMNTKLIPSNAIELSSITSLSGDAAHDLAQSLLSRFPENFAKRFREPTSEFSKVRGLAQKERELQEKRLAEALKLPV